MTDRNGVGSDCASCMFWGAERWHDDNQPYGTCRINPPMPEFEATKLPVGGRLFKTVKIRRGEWPWTAFDDWCGEWKDAEADE